MASHWLQVSRPRLVVRLTALIGCKSHGLSSAVRVLASYWLFESRPPVVFKSYCLQLVSPERNREETLRKGQVDISLYVGSGRFVWGSVLHVVGVAVISPLQWSGLSWVGVQYSRYLYARNHGRRNYKDTKT